MLNKNAKKWVKALRSGKYKQTTNSLRAKNKFCCLGVACELAVKAKIIPPFDGVGEEYAGQDNFLPDEVIDWLGLSSEKGDFFPNPANTFVTNLTTLNDNGRTFKQIAKIIESEPKGLFKRS